MITVHLGYAAGDSHALLDGDLYLPQQTWDADRERCRKAGIPEAVPYRPKWQIALDLLDRTMAHGVRFKYLAADEAYGRCEQFRTGVDGRGLTYVVEVNRNQYGWSQHALAKHPLPDVRRVDQLGKRGGPSWNLFQIKNTGNGPVVWEVRATRFVPCKDQRPGKECWLIVARNVLDGEVKYFLSNAPADEPVEVLLHGAFSRWHIERVFEDGKGEIGLDHFEVRQYRSIMRQFVLSMVSFLFLMRETQRLQKKPRWTICQVREAVEVQLDPRMPKRERLRRLEKVARRIEHNQHATEKAVRSHTKTRYRQLRAMGIYVSRIPKCYHVFWRCSPRLNSLRFEHIITTGDGQADPIHGDDHS